MTLLLTGATGFVGRNLLLQALREKRYGRIWLPVRNRRKLIEQLRGEGYSEVPAEVFPIEASAEDWRLGEAAGADHVIHSAGVLFAKRRDDYFSTNVDGTLRLLRAVKPSSRAILLSSQAAAGPCGRGEIAKDETSPDSPLTWYGRSKLEMEKRVAAEFFERGCLILRPPMVLGPRDQATLPLFKMARGIVRFKPGFQRKWYSYVSVTDLCSAIYAALASESAWQTGVRRYFIASDQPISDRDLIDTAARSLSRKGWLLRVPQGLIWVVSRLVDWIPAWRAALPSLTADRAKEIWPNRWVVSASAFQRDFDWKPQANLLSVLGETAEWYRKSGELGG